MKTSKQYIFLLLGCCLLATPVQAQRNILRATPIKLKAPVTQQTLSAMLQKRVETSFIKAFEMQQHFPLETKLLGTYPFQSIQDIPATASQLYPEMTSCLTTEQQLADYILSNQNRRLIPEIFHMEQLWNYLKIHFSDLYIAQHTISAEQDQYMYHLTRQVPADTQYILLGEVHCTFLRQYIADFLIQLRQQYPNKEIVLLTEFLKEGPKTQAEWQTAPAGLSTVFNTAQQLQIPVVGLEPNFVSKTETQIILGGNSLHYDQTLWITLEGLAIRNRRWMQIIQQQYKIHPDALFVIYAGSGHLSYYQPYNISHILPPEKTFSILLLPQDLTRSMNGLFEVSPFDQLLINKNIPPYPFVSFDKAYTNWVGFDVRIFLEEK
ncbi:MAG: hypothetical protein J5601_02830 [Elusimicrobiaceae bacterium]|nr:hypothetical protein [Elusimicrobiaceae bacterium]